MNRAGAGDDDARSGQAAAVEVLGAVKPERADALGRAEGRHAHGGVEERRVVEVVHQAQPGVATRVCTMQ